jgi:hypothetical protein
MFDEMATWGWNFNFQIGLFNILDKISKYIFITSKGAGLPGGQMDLEMSSTWNSNFAQILNRVKMII